MKTCEVCSKEFYVKPVYASSEKRKCCSHACAYTLRRVQSGNTKRQCLNCDKCVKAYKGKYCSNKCQKEFEWKELKTLIESDQINELGFGLEYSTSIAKRFLIEKNGAKCQKCGWAEINPHTNRIPIEIDHIDGDCTNNKLHNLKLLCPNCHSLTPTYKGANKGNGSARYDKWKKYFSSNN
jgi:hypothetical protein